jgi:hypothetical protein
LLDRLLANLQFSAIYRRPSSPAEPRDQLRVVRHLPVLFPGLDPMDSLSTRQLNRAIHAAAEAAKIDKRVSMHTLRHSFATHLLEQKVGTGHGVWSRRIVGWAIGEEMTADLVLAALNMALQQRKPAGVIHHSDQGSQYTSIAFGERYKKMGVRPSMGTVGDAYDNAMAESFFATLECELIDRRSWQTKTDARLALFTYIEGWYNPRRRHSSLNQTSPANFERNHANPIRSQHGLPTAGARVASAAPPVDNPAPESIRPT